MTPVMHWPPRNRPDSRTRRQCHSAAAPSWTGHRSSQSWHTRSQALKLRSLPLQNSISGSTRRHLHSSVSSNLLKTDLPLALSTWMRSELATSSEVPSRFGHPPKVGNPRKATPAPLHYKTLGCGSQPKPGLLTRTIERRQTSVTQNESPKSKAKNQQGVGSLQRATHPSFAP